MKRISHAKSPPSPASSLANGSRAFAAIGLVLSFLYVWLRIQPAIEFPRSAAVYVQMPPVLDFRPAYPGAFVDFVATALSMANYYNWLAALIFTGVVGLAYCAMQGLLSIETPKRLAVLSWLAPCLLLMLRNSYGFPTLAVAIAWLLGMGAALAYATIPQKLGWLKPVSCWGFSSVLFALAGLWPCLLFVILCLLIELLLRRNWLIGILCLSSAAVIPLWFGLNIAAMPTKVLCPWGIGRPFGLTIALFVLPLLALILTGLRRAVDRAGNSAASDSTDRTRAPASSSWLKRDAVNYAAYASLFALGCAAIWLSFDETRSNHLKLELQAQRGDHSQVLALAKRVDKLTPAEVICVHRALYHTGRLSQDLFLYSPQILQTVVPGLGSGLESCRAQSQTLLELGQVNVAEHFLHEALEQEGDRPDTLRLLANVNILKDRPKAARVFLNAMRKVPFHAAQAERRLLDLEADPRLTNDAELNQIRSRMVNTDLPHLTAPAVAFLRQLLHANPRNQMAFEYLMANFLLSRQPEKLIAEIGRLDNFDYAGIPVLYEEAILLHQRQSGQAQLDLHQRQIRAPTRERFEKFWDQYLKVKADPSAVRILAQDFGGTFWFYFFFGQSPSGADLEPHPTESL